MRLIATNTAEAALLEARWRAIARILGPSITLEAVLPGGQVISPPPARGTASGFLQLISAIRSYLHAAGGPLTAAPQATSAPSDLAEHQPQCR